MRRAMTSRKVAFCAIATAFCFLAIPSHAVNINAVPSIALEETWDSNIFNLSENERGDFIFRARPDLTLFFETYQTTVRLSGGFEFERYADHDELDDDTATKYLNMTVTEPLRLTPRFSLLPSARYIETDDSNRRNVLQQDPIPGLPPSSTVVTTRNTEKNFRGSLRLLYLLTPNVDFSLGGGWEKRDFVGDVSASDEEDSQTIFGDVAVEYRNTPRFSYGAFVNVGHNTFDNNPDSMTYAGGLTGTWLLSQYYVLNARAGASYLKQDAGATQPKDEQWSPTGSLSLTYTWQYFQATLLGSYELAGGGNFGQTTERGTVSLALKNQFAARWWWDLSGSYQTNVSVANSSTEDIDTMEASAGLRYTAREWATLRLSGNFLHQVSHGSDGSDIDRGSIFLGVDLSTFYRLY